LEDGIPQILWETPREINTSFFIIERADTGHLFTSITTVKASGYSQFPKSYLHNDLAAPSMRCRYRVILVMMDGTRIIAEPAHEKKQPAAGRTNVLAVE
ncbi:MAG: hypothetical protein ACPF9D_12415, partial [Owenweeksia sp.]